MTSDGARAWGQRQWEALAYYLQHGRPTNAQGRSVFIRVAFAEGKNVKQVQEWLGQADPGFTLRTYGHLLDEGLGDADFLDEAVTADPSRVNAGSTEGPQAAANAGTVESADMAL